MSQNSSFHIRGHLSLSLSAPERQRNRNLKTKSDERVNFKQPKIYGLERPSKSKLVELAESSPGKDNKIHISRGDSYFCLESKSTELSEPQFFSLFCSPVSVPTVSHADGMLAPPGLMVHIQKTLLELESKPVELVQNNPPFMRYGGVALNPSRNAFQEMRDKQVLKSKLSEMLKTYFFPISEKIKVTLKGDDFYIHFIENEGSKTIEESHLFLLSKDACRQLTQDPHNEDNSENRLLLVKVLMPIVLQEFVSDQTRFIPPNDGYDELALLIKSSGISEMLYWMMNLAIFSAGTKLLYDYGISHAWEEVKELYQGIQEAKSENNSEKLKQLYWDFSDHIVELISLSSMAGGTSFGALESLVHGIDVINSALNGAALANIESIQPLFELLSTSFLGLGSFLTIYSGGRQISKAVNGHRDVSKSVQQLEEIITQLEVQKLQMKSDLQPVFTDVIDSAKKFKDYLMSEDAFGTQAVLSRGVGLLMGGALLATINAWHVAAEVGGGVALSSVVTGPGALAILCMGVGLVFFGLTAGIMLENREKAKLHLACSDRRYRHDFRALFSLNKLSEDEQLTLYSEFIGRRHNQVLNAWKDYTEIRHYLKPRLIDSLCWKSKKYSVISPENEVMGGEGFENVTFTWSSQESRYISRLEKSRLKGHFSAGLLSISEVSSAINSLRHSELLELMHRADFVQDDSFYKSILKGYLAISGEYSNKQLFDKWILHLNSHGLLPIVLYEMASKDWSRSFKYLDTSELVQSVKRERVFSEEKRGWFALRTFKPVSGILNRLVGYSYFNDSDRQKARHVQVIDINKILNTSSDSAETLTPIQQSFLIASIKAFFGSKTIGKQLRADIVQAVRFSADPKLLLGEKCEDEEKGGVCKGHAHAHQHGGNLVKNELDRLRENLMG